MKVCSHGAFRSFNSVYFPLRSALPMRPFSSRGARPVAFLERQRCRRRCFSLPRSRKVLFRDFLSMSSRKATHQLWDVSRGIVFAGGSGSGSGVVYPRLPPVRHQSAPAGPAAAAPKGGSAVMPSLLPTGNALEQLSAGQGAVGVQGSVATTWTVTHTTAVTVAGFCSTAAVDGDATENEDTAAGPNVAEAPKRKDMGPLSPPFTPLEFKIPEETYREAKQAAEGSPKSFWTYDMYRGPGKDGSPDAKVKVHYCTSMRTTERVIQEYFMDEKILGFDLEWMVNAPKSFGPRKNVSLIQLASPSRIGLFHVAAYPRKDSLVAPSLKRLMEDSAVTKVGVCIKGDCTRLSAFLHIKTRGQFELSHLYKLVKYSEINMQGAINKRTVSLAAQVEDCLGLPLFKGGDVRKSNWSQRLDMEQIRYSASDAYAALQLYAILDHKRKNLNPVPPLPYHAELNLPIRLTEDQPATSSEEEDFDLDLAPGENINPVDCSADLDPCDPSNSSLDLNPTLRGPSVSLRQPS